LSRVRVKHKGQVTIPKELRSKLGIEEGAILKAKAQDGEIMLKPLPPLEAGDPVGEKEYKKIIAELDQRRRNWPVDRHSRHTPSIHLEFPPNTETKQKTKTFIEKELKVRLLTPSIVIAEFIEIASARIGEEAARNRLRLLKDRGMKIIALDEEHALIAGNLLLSHKNVSTADAIIASSQKQATRNT
jgi:AbrB family looped-hinge helix DNA binding protein